MGQKRLWNNFGTVAKFWNTVRVFRADFLCLFPQQNIRNTFRCLGLVFFDNMAVKVFCGVHAGMTQLLRHCYNIGAICQQYKTA